MALFSNETYSKREIFSIPYKCFRNNFIFVFSKFGVMSNLRSKYRLLMKFGQFMSYCKRKIFIKNFYKNCDLKTSSRLFCVCKELSTTFIRKSNFWSNQLILDMQDYQNLSKPACTPPQIPFYRGFFGI